MKVYALVGKSGTGKSFHAMKLCQERNIESLIDDGLYIYRTNVFTGTSAKSVPTKIGAIKTALFTDDAHRDQVANLIKKTKPESLLIVGTSDGMVERIDERLGLPPITEIVRIEAITTASERYQAHKQRYGQGKHIVPIPSAQLKREFSGYFMAPIRMMKGLGIGGHSDGEPEKTVVRPTYSYLGEFIISDKVISDIVKMTAKDLEGVESIVRIIAEKPVGELNITILARFNTKETVVLEARKLQKECAEKIENMTAFSINKIDVEVREVI